MTIQSNYPLNQERGQIGALSRPTMPFRADRVRIAAAGAGLRPGDAYKLDANGDAVKLSNLADSVNAEGIIGFEYGTVNQTLAGGTNNVQGIEYAEGDMVKVFNEGSVYVIGGEALIKGVEIGFDPADHTWKAQANGKRSMRTNGAITGDGAVAEVLLGSYLSTAATAAALAAAGAAQDAADAAQADADTNTGAIAALDGRVTALEGA